MARIRSNIRRSKSNFPWFWLLALLGSIYLFWIFPKQRPAAAPEFSDVVISTNSR